MDSDEAFEELRFKRDTASHIIVSLDAILGMMAKTKMNDDDSLIANLHILSAINCFDRVVHECERVMFKNG